MKEQIKKGFSLLELILVLGVGTTMGYLKLQDMKHNQEDIMAQAVGSQMKQMGEAVNRYISIRYDRLSTLSNAAGTGTDPGPRTCSASLCEITYRTLVNEGLLPSSYGGINVQKSEYKILLKREGTAPNYVINGLVITTLPWTEGGKTRYDLLGKAMQSAGIDSGMTKSASQVSGYNGVWVEKSNDFTSINKTGLLAYRVGYDSALYSVYLRRDGTLPMTGNLNMGGNDINSAKNITASGAGNFGGDITSGRTITAGREMVAHNGYGDTITMGGDNSGGDYEIRLGNNKPLTIYSPTATSDSVVFQVNNDVKLNRIGTNGINPSDMPTGWGGGIRTWDILAGGTIGLLPDGVKMGSSITDGKQLAVRIERQGNIDAKGKITGGEIKSSGNLYVAGDAQVNGNLTSSNKIMSGGRLTANEFIQINGIVTEGAGCSPNGLQGRDAAGSILSCVSGVWVKAGANLSSSCKWIQASNAYDNISGYKTAACPAGYVMTGLRWFQIPSYVDDEHVDSYCCPLS